MSRARVPRRVAMVLAVLCAATPGARSAAPPVPGADSRGAAIPDDLLRGLRWRSIGPYRGGRSVAVAGLRDQPYVYYFGGTGGGIWKTTDGGIRWTNVSDGQLGTGSVGAVAVAESDPNVVYAGMGEGCIRGNVSHGDGVYRSTDAGKTWTNVGPARHAPDRPHPRAPAGGGHRLRGRARARLRTQRGARRVPLARRRAHLAQGPLRGRHHGRHRHRHGSHATRASSTPRSGRSCARPGAWRAAGRAAASTRRRTAATPGRSWRARACPRGPGAASG